MDTGTNNYCRYRFEAVLRRNSCAGICNVAGAVLARGQLRPGDGLWHLSHGRNDCNHHRHGRSDRQQTCRDPSPPWDFGHARDRDCSRGADHGFRRNATLRLSRGRTDDRIVSPYSFAFGWAKAAPAAGRRPPLLTVLRRHRRRIVRQSPAFPIAAGRPAPRDGSSSRKASSRRRSRHLVRRRSRPPVRFLKYVVGPGVRQDQAGLSIATEFRPLLPGQWRLGNRLQLGRHRVATVGLGHRPSRDQRGEAFLDAIIEGPAKRKVRPVVKVFYDKVWTQAETLSRLAAAIWQVRDNLSFDGAFRYAFVKSRPVNEIRFGRQKPGATVERRVNRPYADLAASGLEDPAAPQSRRTGSCRRAEIMRADRRIFPDEHNQQDTPAPMSGVGCNRRRCSHDRACSA
jgi:hypothetical protein